MARVTIIGNENRRILTVVLLESVLFEGMRLITRNGGVVIRTESHPSQGATEVEFHVAGEIYMSTVRQLLELNL